MSNIKHFKPSSVQTAYNEASEHLGNRLTCKIDHNTYLSRVFIGRVSVLFYGHPIIFYWHNGEIDVSACGYRTYTTKDRLNKFLPPGFSVYQRKHQWYLSRAYMPREFWDGMII